MCNVSQLYICKYDCTKHSLFVFYSGRNSRPSYFPGTSRLAGSVSAVSPTCSGKEPLEIHSTGFLWAGQPSHHPKVKTFMETQSTVPSQWSELIVSSATAHRQNGFAPTTPILQEYSS